MFRALVTGASGYVGRGLVRELRALGEPVGCVVCDPGRVSFDWAVKVHRADMLDAGSLSAIGEGYTTAYYLVHSMGHGGDANCEKRDATAAANFARFATTAKIERIVYLGGLAVLVAASSTRPERGARLCVAPRRELIRMWPAGEHWLSTPPTSHLPRSATANRPPLCLAGGDHG